MFVKCFENFENDNKHIVGGKKDDKLVKQLECKLAPLSVSIPSHTFKGGIIFRVAHQTAPSFLTLSGNRQEHLVFLIIHSQWLPLVLTHPGLSLHNLLTDRLLGKQLPYCHDVCIKSALSAAGGTNTLLAHSWPDLSEVPSEHHDLIDLFLP